ncbi:MAG: hypothetical protein JSU65_00010 [Candidatus Zixiibacteriota bacterium]|nr:MAG: hypothetical protein JSU65_00010 [candidate division Zixibacteria bacterium]
MTTFYRLMTSFAYRLVYPFGSLRASQGREFWRGRLGRIPSVGPKDVWIHAASVGEARVISYLVDYLRRCDTSISIHVTVMTETGFKTAGQLLPHDVTLSYFPLDAVPAIRRTFERISPRVLVIAETEIWPNLISTANDRGVPIVLVNGRMSERARKRYRLIKGAMSNLLKVYDRFFFKTEADAGRFSEFGVAEYKSVVAGDMKFDAPLLKRSEGRIREIRRRAGVKEDEFLLVAGSTRSGEEEQLVQCYLRLKKTHPQLRLLLAPRHIERCKDVSAMLLQKDQPYYMYGADDETDGIIVVNRMGLLNELYSACDAAFVGGTLVDVGGHNLLEPVWAGRPVLFGPSISNVEEAADYIAQGNYGTKVSSLTELENMLDTMLNGNCSFAVKVEGDMALSATARAGDYIMQRLHRD